MPTIPPSIRRIAKWLVLPVILIVLVDYWFQRPTDASLVKQFRKKRVVFEELRSMLQTDRQLGSVQSSGVTLTNHLIPAHSLEAAGISSARYELYLKKLREAGAWAAIHDEEEFRFAVAASGGMGKGYRIAITYRETKPEPLLSNLDDFRKTKREWEQAYRPIEGNWYLWIIW